MAGLGLRFRGGFRALLGILAEQVDVQNAEEGVDDDESREREPYRGVGTGDTASEVRMRP